MNKLNDSDLENVSGGFLFNARNISGSDPANPWEVIDNRNGNVIARFNNEQAAKAYCQQQWGGANTYDTMEINWSDVCALRNRPMA